MDRKNIGLKVSSLSFSYLHSVNNINDYHNHPAYHVFLSSINSARTKKLYTYYLDKYYLSRPENRSLTLDQILSKSTKEIEFEILNITEGIKNTLNLSYATVCLAMASIIHFFEINDVLVNKKKLKKFKGDNVTKFEYRSYTTEEISKLLNVCDERIKAAILLMASSGMRVGALPGIKLKHLKKWNIDNSSTHVYKILVYANSPKDKYFTFCTPEAAKAVDDYLDLRARFGDDLNLESFLFIRTFDKMAENPIIVNKRAITPDAITVVIVKSLVEAGLRTIYRLNKVGPKENKLSLSALHKNELHPCHSLRIFCVTNMQRAKVDKTIREMLVGHKTGLDSSYYKPQDEEILQEYLKAADLLTINNENKLKKQIKELEDKTKDTEYIINGKLQEKDEELKSLKQKYESDMKAFEEKMESKFQQILLKINVDKLGIGK